MNRSILSLLLIAHCYTATATNTEESNDHEEGRKIYNFRCYYCHGYSGDAKTLASTFLTSQPKNFSQTSLTDLPREQMIQSVTHGIANSAMKPFSSIIDSKEIELVVDFVRNEFMRNHAINTLYHSVENGWPDHQRYAIAFPFATGDIKLDTPDRQLDQQQLEGKKLFLNTCISCHDRSHVSSPGRVWELRALSYPRDHYSHKAPPIDAESSASIYAKHERSPKIENLSPMEQQGERLFIDNCAFCHGAAGTGKNWIGSFLEPHPRNLTDPQFMKHMTRKRLRHVIREGLPGTSMPAWKHNLNEGHITALIHYISRAFHSLPMESNADE